EGARFLDAAIHYSRRHHALIEPRPEDASPFPEATSHLLTAGASPAPEFEHDFNDDYNMTRFPGFRRLPWFLRCRRFVCLDGDPRYLQIYELSQRDYFPNAEARNSVYGNPRSQGLIAAVKSTVSLYDRLP